MIFDFERSSSKYPTFVWRPINALGDTYSYRTPHLDIDLKKKFIATDNFLSKS